MFDRRGEEREGEEKEAHQLNNVGRGEGVCSAWSFARRC